MSSGAILPTGQYVVNWSRSGGESAFRTPHSSGYSSLVQQNGTIPHRYWTRFSQTGIINDHG
ncbi:hypothetical protein SSOG_07044 [Streptomyces himastatinicus ATCC 53653]|uniref:Uncharacterized protein n=1 Tax=Streptomyces himastatinicus ATCC 53653 TaxID=457427 RepID=D9WF20_9ACTN|nr:hypothetical protein SSOG_07044 [Streptomyces himastatinicus ATCC 53653]